MNPLVSLIMPVYNRETFLNKTVSSIIKQTYMNWELIIVDDRSTDNSYKIATEFSKKEPRIKVILRPEIYKKGANVCRNIGFEKAQGLFINWFDSDDIMLPNFISEKLEAFEDDIDMVLSKTVRVYPNGEKIYEKRTKLTENLLQDYITTKISWYLPDGMFRRSSLASKSLFKEDVFAGQDRDFYIRSIGDYRVRIVDLYLTEYLCHEKSISHAVYRTDDYQMQLSVCKSLMGQVNFLKDKELLNPELKKFYFEEIKNKLPAVMKCNSLKREYFKILYDLSGGLKGNLIPWGKIFLSYLSFLFFGKGERVLKMK